MNAKRLIVITGLVLLAGTVAIVMAAPPTCASAYCVRNSNTTQFNIATEGTLFDARGNSAGWWIVWLDTDGNQNSITVTGYNLETAFLPDPDRPEIAALVPNPNRLPRPSDYDVTAVAGGNVTITGKNGRMLPKEFMLVVHGLDDTLWGVLGPASAYPTPVPSATPLATVTPVPTATALPTLPAPSAPAPTATP